MKNNNNILFQKLVKDSSTKYIDYCKKNNVSEDFIKLLNEKDREQRLEIWNNYKDIFDTKQIANPYFIGTGNPNSEILIIGKELGFNDDKQIQFYNEVVQNSFDWEEILENEKVECKNYISPEENVYNSPRKPYNGHYTGLSSGHTWRKYNDIVSRITNKTCDSENSFFDYCFLTEFNTSPSKYSTGKHVLCNERKEFLQNDFFKSFKYVILTYRTYDKYNEGLTELLFDVIFKKHGKIGKQEYLLFQDANNERNVILTNQLSGMAGWSVDELTQLSDLLKF